MNNVPKYNSCPPRMEDGRHFTDYRPRCVVDSTIRSQNNIKNNFDYRMFLINNGDKIIQNFRYEAIKKNKCNACDNKGADYKYPVKEAF
jgi:hypothetical protein